MMIVSEYVREDNWRPKCIVFPAAHEADDRIKTVEVRRHRSTQNDRAILDDFKLIIPRVPEKAKSCPLYDEYGAKNFLVLMFEKSCRQIVIEKVVKAGLHVQTAASSGGAVLYKFFGHSPTQLRNRSCVLYNSRLEQTNGCYERIIGRFGTFDMTNVSKRAARIGLLLSSGKKVIDLEENQIQHLPDAYDEKREFCFTDGCGYISREIAKRITPVVYCPFQYEHQKNPYPSVYQVRFQGCKDILMLTTDPMYKNSVGIPDSMEKFRWNTDMDTTYQLRVVDDGKGVSFPNQFGSLNTQIIRLLSALGVPDEVFMRKQKAYFDDLDKILHDPDIQVRYLCAYKSFYMAEQIVRNGRPDEETMKALKKLQATCYVPKSYRTRMEQQQQRRGRSGEREVPIKVKLKLPLEQSRHVYGVADPSGQLEYGTCFFQPTIRGTPTVLNGRVVVSRSPSYHTGDIRVLRCVNVIECDHFVDCIVFPVRGPRPHPDEMAGGDLDGDKFFVCWDEDVIPPRMEEPTSYTGSSSKSRVNITYSDLVKYFYEYNTHNPSKLDRLYEQWANAKGADCAECRLVANLFNQAIDSAKTGKEISIPEFLNLAPPPAPDRFVWQKMESQVTCYQQQKLKDASSDASLDGGETLRLLTYEEIEAHLRLKDSRIPEFNLFRLAYKWCDGQKRMMFENLRPCINFDRMTAVEREESEKLVQRIDSKLSLREERSQVHSAESFDNYSDEIRQIVNRIAQNKALVAAALADTRSLLEDKTVKSLIESDDQAADYIRALAIRLREVGISEYGLFQFVAGCCERKMKCLLARLVPDIDFARLRPVERKLALIDLEPLETFHTSQVENALYQSKILSENDVKVLSESLKGRDHRWVRYQADEKCSQTLWQQWNDILTTDVVKLIVFRLTVDEAEWVIAVFIPDKLYLGETIRVGRGDCRTRIFVSVHSSDHDDFCLTPLSEDYHLALDGNRLQIFMDNSKKDRTQTFVCLMNLENEHDSIGLSVALNRFHRSNFSREHNGAKVRREEVSRFEIFLNHPKPMVAPAILVSQYEQLERLKAESTDPENFHFDPKFFPALGEDDDPAVELSDHEVQRQKLEYEYFQTRLKLTQHLSIKDELRKWVDDMNKSKESMKVEIAYKLESLLAEMDEQDAPFESDVYFSIMSKLLRYSASFETVTRLLGTIARQCGTIGYKQYCRLLNDIVYCCDDRRLAVRILQYVQIQEHIPLKVEEYYSPEGLRYFKYWMPLLSIELLSEIEDREKSIEKNNAYYKAQPFVDKFTIKGVEKRKVILNICGSVRPFTEQDGLTLSFNPAMERKPLFFAEMSDMTGMVLTVRVVWPEFGDELLLDMLKEAPDSQWRVDVFPNFIVYRRQLEALKTVCIKGYEQPKPSLVIHHIVSLWSASHESKQQQARRQPADHREAESGGSLTEDVPGDAIPDVQPGTEASVAGCASSVSTNAMPEEDSMAAAPAADLATLMGERQLPSDVVTDEATPPEDIRQIPRPATYPTSYEPAGRTEVLHSTAAAEDMTAEGRCGVLPPRLQRTRQMGPAAGRVAATGHRGRRIPMSTDLNESQRLAVEAAVNEPLTLIQGPPGTGKTKTAAVIVKEWLAMDQSRVLVAAQSNEAVNNLFVKLCDVGIPSETIVRIGNVEKMSPAVRKFSFEENYLKKADTKQRQHFDSKLADEVFENCRVVCSTCIGAGSVPLKMTKFSRVLIDEAAQACEPECLVAMCAGAQTICLVGDHKQLPPLVKSREAPELRISLFERLQSTRQLTFHMLDTQYRMHPAISRFPSQRFYGGRLKDGVQGSDRPAVSGIYWPHLQMPLVFYNLVNGKDECAEQSKLNKAEADYVVKLVSKFIEKGARPADIGIITPYAAQKQHLRNLLLEQQCPKVDVRTVDGFQGQERDVIIFSAVRANDDGKGLKQIGFLQDEHRTNVLLTRAKRGLVVVGNRATLESNEMWKSWIDFMDGNGLIEDINGGDANADHAGGDRRTAAGGSGTSRGRGRGRGDRGHDNRSSGAGHGQDHRGQGPRGPGPDGRRNGATRRGGSIRF